MARKRKLDSTISQDAATPPEDAAPRGGMGGMWAGSAMNLLKQRIEATHGSLVQGILNGTVAIELSPEQIEDQAGSDRIADWADDEEFAALVDNIRRRGQTQPVRVRPSDPDWTPDDEHPLQTSARFVVQSGRRRIEACRQLGRPVLALLSTATGDAALADLEERFHENTMRKNLNGFEELLSIGLLAESLRDLTQEEIAARLSVSQNDVSLGLACVALREEILQQVDIPNTPKRAYRTIIPKLRRGGQAAKDQPAQAKERGAFASDAVRVEVQPGRGGLLVKVAGENLDSADLDRIARDIAAIFH